MVTGSQDVFNFLTHQAGREGQSASDAFGGRDNIRLNAVIHVGIERSAASVACLDFVDDQRNVIFLREFRGLPDKILIQGDHAALTLHAFHHDPRGVDTEGCFL